VVGHYESACCCLCYAGVVDRVFAFKNSKDAERKRDELVESEDYNEFEDVVDLTYDVPLE
jgi:hypothetical protein